MKILYGISGIGTGHSNRQIPIIDYFLKRNSQIVFFCYGESLRILSDRYMNQENISIIPIDIPFIVGNLFGLDWEQTAKVNKGRDFITINSLAMARASELIGKPDLVISDYEPLSAQYAYAYDSKFFTLDQQSKYLIDVDYPKFEGQSFQDEIARLRMFFPKADARIACSFFDIEQRENKYGVKIFPSTLKDEIINMRREVDNSILIYISSQKAFVQDLESVMEMCSTLDEEFHIFIKDVINIDTPHNVRIYQHGDPRFMNLLSKCKGLVSTAGHTLLSEAMYLGIPVYAIPLPVYEQHMNAYCIEKNGFGMSRPRLEKDSLNEFIQRIPEYIKSIENDEGTLLRGPGQAEIIKYLGQIVGGAV